MDMDGREIKVPLYCTEGFGETLHVSNCLAMEATITALGTSDIMNYLSETANMAGQSRIHD